MKFYIRQWMRTPLLCLICVLGMIVSPYAAEAEVAYGTFTKDNYGFQIETQPAYYPHRIIGAGLMKQHPDDPAAMAPSPLQKPSDVFIDSRDEIYIADTGNNRIVKFDKYGEWVRYYELPESPLNAPQGVFVDDNGDIYVADTGNKRVVRLSADGELLKEYKRPESRNVPDELKFDPTKVIVDKRGYVYIVTMGGYYGMVQLDPEGEFKRFYGANAAPFSLLDAVKRAIYTREMYENETRKIPPPVSNVAIDREGIIYTVTNGPKVGTEQIKKLNFQGENILAQYSKFGTAKQSFGELNRYDVRFAEGEPQFPQLVDVAVDGEGNFTVLDSLYAYISQYDADGNLLFYWGGPSSPSASQLGLLKVPVSIETNSRGELFVLDSQENMLQVYRLSEFGAMVHHANRLTQQGRYIESEQPWEEVLRLHSEYLPAILGLARAAYKKGDYHEAARLFKDAGNAKGYSESFWQIRLQWFQQRFALFANIFAATVVAYLFLSRLFRKYIDSNRWKLRISFGFPLWIQIKQSTVILKHPIDGFTALRYENKGGYASSFLLLAAASASVVVSETTTSFAFNPVPSSGFNIVSMLMPFFGLWSGWVLCNYLISSIYRGEGRFKDVFVGSAYALTPLILVGVPLAFLSNAMTHSEGAIYEYLHNGMYIWLALLFLWKVQSLHNYSVGETLLNIAMTFVALAVLAVLIFLVVGLTNELLTFIHEVYREVALR
ncbi:YIP1 family protein [Paenibacillus alkalitolerans]|uniref:YIP1 family protein n=1 Tax=Paenibacillus alkalitolerans TaxID=2799335 RepID=UPI001F1B5966|nr:YIP1 family protein [Paenibacillus alkalitolerans]